MAASSTSMKRSTLRRIHFANCSSHLGLITADVQVEADQVIRETLNESKFWHTKGTETNQCKSFATYFLVKIDSLIAIEMKQSSYNQWHPEIFSLKYTNIYIH